LLDTLGRIIFFNKKTFSQISNKRFCCFLILKVHLLRVTGFNSFKN
jgi:hypothetical protein